MTHFTLMSQCFMFPELALKMEGLVFPQKRNRFPLPSHNDTILTLMGAWFFSLIPPKKGGTKKLRISDQKGRVGKGYRLWIYPPTSNNQWQMMVYVNP